MSCTISKRSFDAIGDSFSSPSHHHAAPVEPWMNNNSFGTPPKRCRPSPVSSPYADGGSSPPHKAAFQRTPSSSSHPNSPFPARHATDGDVETLLERVVPRQKRTRLFAPASNTSASSPLHQMHPLHYAPSDHGAASGMTGGESSGHHDQHAHQHQSVHSSREILFTLDQVKAIVQRAVAEREEVLRNEYNVILKEKLTEQYENFAKFNEDYISRQLRESNWDYMT